MSTFGPEYFEDKDPSYETAQAATDTKARGFTIIYPRPFLKKLNPNFVPPAAVPDVQAIDVDAAAGTQNGLKTGYKIKK